MQHDGEPWGDDIEIEPEVWVQALLAMIGDKDRKEELVRKSLREDRSNSRKGGIDHFCHNHLPLEQIPFELMNSKYNRLDV